VLSGAAVSLSRVANAVRWMGAGPRAGIGEIQLPAVQPGSSMMPAKINPVIAESLLQVCAHVSGAHAALTLAGATGAAFELHTSWPLAAHALLTSISYLSAGAGNFARLCVDGIEPTARGPQTASESLMCVTGLLPLVGYDAAAAIAKKAAAEERSIVAVALEECRGLDGMDEHTVRTALSPHALLGPYDMPQPPS
jgi:fumarate hydratase class II